MRGKPDGWPQVCPENPEPKRGLRESCVKNASDTLPLVGRLR
jgi:hypothetical protein